MRGKATSIALAATIMAGGAARAEWQQATTKHFIVYADDNAGRVRDLAERLERFDALLRLSNKPIEDPERPANRVAVFMVNDGQEGIKRLGAGADVAGFYLPRATGSVIFTPKRIGDGGKSDMSAQIVLFHEYGHHFLLRVFTGAYPSWFLEGYPEYVSTVRFDSKVAYLGEPANHRGYGLMVGPGVSIETMFSPYGRKLSAPEREAVYGRGWVLTHMVKNVPAIREQFVTYVNLLNAGTPSLDAARKAFGDLKQLDRQMIAYMARPMMRSAIPLDKLGTPSVDVRAVSSGAAAIIEGRMRSTRGVDRKTGEAIFARWAPVAARFPTDALAQGWLAEMAFDAGRDAEADAAADRALAADPGSAQAMLYKARVRLRRAADDKAIDPKVWNEARAWILKANALNPDEAAPFVLFHESFGMARQQPSKSAVSGLYRAMELAPQDRSLRMAVAFQALNDGDAALAKAAIQPVAYDPHAAPDNPAMQLLKLLDGRDTAAALALLARQNGDGKGAD